MKPGLITVIVPVFDPDMGMLTRALDSVSDQTLEKELIRLVVVDDGSGRHESLDFLATLAESGSYGDVPAEVVRHPENLWLAQARVTGARHADTPFIVFLDCDDYISPDYLKKAIILLSSNPQCSWTYPSTRCFGEYSEDRPAKGFRPFGFFLRNRNPYASVYRREAWLEVSQRERKVVGNVRFFEDWDTTIRLMARGHFGAPLADSTFYYCKRSLGLNSRPTKIYLLSIYITWRANLFRAPLIVWSALRHGRNQRRNKGVPAKLNPIRLGDTFQRFVLRRALEMPEFSGVLDTRSIVTGLFSPERFTSQFLDPGKSITLAEIRCGFVRKPRLPPAVDERILGDPDPGAVLFAHTWWTVGGSENVLLEWMDAANKAKTEKILDLTQFSHEENEGIRRRFAEYAGEQYCLARVGDTPRERLMFCWNLVCHNRPRLILISANACLYALTPHIKKQFPEITIADILHNEWRNGIDWFNVAQEYQDHIDYRIVVSEHWRDRLVHKYSENEEKIQVFPNFIDTDRFSPSREAADDRHALRFDAGEKIVCFIGRLHEQKHPEVFCELAADFTGNSGYRFVVVGDGPLEEALVSRYGHLPNLEFRGMSLAVEKYLAASDIVVFCSRYEGSPLGSLEAAAMNVPIIAPDITGFREQINEGGIGLLYAPTHESGTDASQIADLIRHHGKELVELSRGARDFVLRKHSKVALKRAQVLNFRALTARRTADAPPVMSERPGKRLYLHIGWTKTGTSSIQHFLYYNRETLIRQGLYYPVAQEWGFAHHLLAYYFTYIPKHASSTLWNRFSDKETFKASVGRHIDSLTETPFEHIVISSELLRRADPTLLAERFSPFEVVVITYLRRQDEWLEATINQNIKMASGSTFELDSREKWHRICRRILDYYTVLERWAEVFGPGNLRVVPFESCNFPKRLERHFVELIDIEWSEEFKLGEIKNRRLNRDSLAFIQENWDNDRSGDPEFHRTVQGLEEWSAQNPDPPEYACVLPPATRVDVLNYCRENNEKVARRFLGRPDGALFTRAEPSPEDAWEPYPGLSPQRREEIRAYLLERGFDVGGSRRIYPKTGLG